MNLMLVDRFADAVADVVRPRDPPAGTVDALEGLLDHWAAMSPAEAPGDRPGVVLPCAAVLAYGAVGAVRPEWWSDETAKLRRAASDGRWRVRQGLGFTVSVVVAARGDFSLLGELVRSDDADLRWVARENLRKKRLARWPDEVAHLRSELERDRP
jgi:hypothetical protein